MARQHYTSGHAERRAQERHGDPPVPRRDRDRSRTTRSAWALHGERAALCGCTHLGRRRRRRCRGHARDRAGREPGRGACGQGRRAGGGRQTMPRPRQEIRTALRLDPDSVDVLREAGPPELHVRRYAEAAAYWEKQFDAGRDRTSRSGGLLITCYTALGDRPNVKRVGAAHAGAGREGHCESMRDNGSAMAAMFSCLLYLGEGDRAKEWAQARRADRPGQHDHALQPGVRPRGEPRRRRDALEMLGPYCSRTGREQLEWLKSDPDMDPLREDPRFQAMVEQAERRSPRSNPDRSADFPQLRHDAELLPGLSHTPQVQGTSRAIAPGGRRHHDRRGGACRSAAAGLRRGLGPGRRRRRTGAAG